MARCNPPLDVLIVEDEALIALDIGSIVEETGHRVLAEAASLFEVAALDASMRPHVAFVDIQLAGGSDGIQVCRLIRSRWPDACIVFVTANPKKLPEDYAGGHGVVPKPFSRMGLASTMKYLAESVCDPPPVSPQPACFIAAPAFYASWEGEAGASKFDSALR
jgi:CheY-like chemotaxis protein